MGEWPLLIKPMLASLRPGLPADDVRYGWEFRWDLLTELRAGVGQVSGQAGIWVASVCRHGYWRRSSAGVVRSGGAAVGLG